MALSDYTELEYIESTGRQFIGIDYIPKTLHTKYELGFMRTGISGTWNPIINSEEDVRFGIMCTIDGNNQNNYGQFHIGPAGSGFKSVQFPMSSDIKYDIIADKTGISLNGTKYSVSGVGDATGQWSTYINHRLKTSTTFSSEYSIGRWYYLKVYEDDGLIKDYIPARRKSDNVVGLYDKISKQFFVNQGTGTFIAGPEKDLGSQLQQNIVEIQDLMNQCNSLSLDILGGAPKPDPLKDYKKLEYIQSTGSQYINTDINIGATTDIEVKFITVQAASGYGRVWGSTSDMKYELADTGGNTGYRISINGTGYSFSTANDIKIVKMTGNGVVFLNNSQIYNFEKSYTGGEKLWLFWGNSGDWKNVYGRIKLYYAKVWQDNKLVRNYMPVLRKEDNKVGLFDIQNNQFYIDVNNGNFTAGPEIN